MTIAAAVTMAMGLVVGAVWKWVTEINVDALSGIKQGFENGKGVKLG